MNYAQIKQVDVANGPGVRVSLFVSGCTHHCRGCFNAEAWDFYFGQPFTKETQERLLSYMEPDYIAGLTLLGGEPMELHNQEGLLAFVERVREKFPQKSIWCYTGYHFDRDILGYMWKWPVTRRFVPLFDVIVDGEFIAEKKNLSLKYRGSENQRILDVRRSLQVGYGVWVSEFEGDRRECKMNQEKLIQNIIDQIVEAQLKLGYVRESMRFYYPVESFKRLVGADDLNIQDLKNTLKDAFSESGKLGKFTFHVHEGRVEVGVAPEGVEYVHEHEHASVFLKELIRLFQENPHCSLKEIRAVFDRVGKAYICEKMPEGSDFDYVMYFEDPEIDPYDYCIKMEMGHTIYHRFTHADYKRI